MKRSTGLVLTAAALALLATGGWLRRSVPVSAPAGQGAPVPAAVPMPTVSTPAPSSPEAGLALEISQLLGGPRQAPELAASREREAREKAARLVDRLKASPEAWRDVFDLVCCLGDPDVALAVAGLLKGAVDDSLEARLLEVVRTDSQRQARAVALTLLEGRATSDSFVAVQAAADDPDPRIRQGALQALARRQKESPGVVNSILARRVQVEPDPNLRAAARSMLGEAPPAAPRSTSSRGLSLKLKPASK